MSPDRMTALLWLYRWCADASEEALAELGVSREEALALVRGMDDCGLPQDGQAELAEMTLRSVVGRSAAPIT